MTILDALIQSLSRAGEYNRNDQVALAVILWPDKEQQGERRERTPGSTNVGLTRCV